MRWWSSNLLKQPGWGKKQVSVPGFIQKLPFQKEQGAGGCGVISSLTAYLAVVHAAPSLDANHQKQLREKKKIIMPILLQPCGCSIYLKH